MNAQTVFANVLAIRMDLPCPATQDAIDRLVYGCRFRGRAGMLETLRGANYDSLEFNSSLLSAWKPADVKRATDRSVDWWIRLSEAMQARSTACHEG